MPPPWSYEIEMDARGWFLTYQGHDMYPKQRFATWDEAERVRVQWLQEDEEAVSDPAVRG